MKTAKAFVLAVLAGISIALGGLVFLSVDNKVIGAALFTVGLFTVCTFGLNLFTGKVCYVFQNDTNYALMLPVIWLGNLVGTGLTALCASLTRAAPALAEAPDDVPDVLETGPLEGTEDFTATFCEEAG